MSGKKLKVTLYGQEVGELFAHNHLTEFRYYDTGPLPHPISLSLPFSQHLHKKSQKSSFVSKSPLALPLFFENLLPEGWLLSVAKNLSHMYEDKLDVLYHFCRDGIGAVSFLSEHDKHRQADRPKVIQKSQPLAKKTDNINCLACGNMLANKGFNYGYHPSCSFEIFGQKTPPNFLLQESEILNLAKDQLKQGRAIGGAQVKLSLLYKDLTKTLSDSECGFIVKPQIEDGDFGDLPRMEHLANRFASKLGLNVAKTSIIKTDAGRDAFVTKRFDRSDESNDSPKIHIEDMSQATHTPKGDYDLRYLGSYELLGKTFQGRYITDKDARYSKNQLFKSLIFNMLIGNTDAHLKNHSIIWNKTEGTFKMAPFYDIVPNKLYCNDTHDIGLKLEGKNIVTRESIESFQSSLGLPKSTFKKFIEKFDSEMSFFEDLMDKFAIKEHRIEKMKGIIKASFDKISVKKPHPISEKSTTQGKVIGDSLKNPDHMFIVCLSKICRNPNGPTKLKGMSRKKLGLCSFCKPEL